ncbi:two component transcriptional regulator, LytTR family [Chryseolinea serpens]|uniref:Two component transcriptional regulator, LytTR family n=1 Tax=Chryseolinea serpens TaxID=947013 RepID=A0A1M5VT48_9BACT|nr:LytTR family DNA-binding domain-containing protein [Chryseolinea serpens]SHH78449.1 two component transcriptional regulator, LytTR family [Chryseolinea serpens]
MNILIIEDELKASKSLADLITTLRPAYKIIAQLQSIERAVAYFSENKEPDLVFLDIELADGLSFEIFKTVKLHCPIIFCTAYGQYAMDAIKANGIDYVLKPFSRQDIQTALEKVESFKNFFQQEAVPDWNALMSKIGVDDGKKSFLVFRNNKYTSVQTDAIAFFYIKEDATTIMTFQQQEYSIAQSLDQLAAVLSAKQFFRVNRQYLINFAAVKEVEHYFARKLFVRLVIPTPEKLLIGKEKTSAFLGWLEDR